MNTRSCNGLIGFVLLCTSATVPVLPYCSFSSAVTQAGLLGSPVGQLLLPTPGADVGGFFWDHGQGNPADGFGIDSGTLSGFPVGPGDAPWIRRDLVPASIDWNWFYYGTDGCLSGGAGSGVAIAYILDNDPAGTNYAVLAVTGTQTPAPGHDFDRINTGEGVSGNEVPLEPLLLVPEILDVTVVDDDYVRLDVGPALTSINFHDDLGGAGPYADLFDLSGVADLFHREPGSGTQTPIPGCVAAGCSAIEVPRDHEVCWGGSARVVGRHETNPAVCSGGPLNGLSCLPDYPGDACVVLGGTCPIPPPTYYAMGPEIPGGCSSQEPPLDADGDGFVAGTDCDDADPNIYPGAPQFCDGKNNDCDHPAWPSLPEAECFDVNNMLVTETGGLLQFDWDVPAQGADSYEVFRGTRSVLEHGNGLGPPWATTPANQAQGVDPLGPGELACYVVAGVRGGIRGSLGRNSQGQERAAANP